MAEGGDISSIQGGSDVDIEFTCTPCGEDGTREEAVKYCPECQEYLCARCTKYHGRVTATRAHKLIDKEDAKHDSIAVKTTTVVKCRYHPDRDIEMYCGTHDMVYCLLCIAIEHRSCNDVSKIDDASLSCVDQKELQRLQTEMMSIHEQLLATHEKKEKNIKSLEKKRNQSLNRIQEVERKMKEHLEKMKKKATDDLSERYSEVKGEVESDITVVTDMITEVEKTTKQLQMAVSMDQGQRFVQIKLGQKTATDAKKLYEDDKTNGLRSIHFTENVELSELVLKTTSLGQVSTTFQNKKQSNLVQMKMKSKKEVNVKVQNDKRSCYLSDVCQLKDGTIILVDRNNCKLKRLDTNYNVNDYYDLHAQPVGVCCTGQNEVAVKMANQKVQFIYVGTSLSKLREISIVRGGQFGIAHCAGELWISNINGVNVYNNSGTLLKYIEKDPNGQNLVKGLLQNMYVSEDSVFLTDGRGGIVCFGRDRTMRKELRDQRLVYTRGVCVSSDGTVFMAGFNSNNIVMFSGDGKCLGELVSADVGLKNPLSMCYDNNKNCIIVTCGESDSIHVIELCE